jgi:molybdopterin converting factor small subunit
MLEVLVFGELVDIIGSEKLSIAYCSNTNELYSLLYDKFPALQNKTFLVAQNNLIISTQDSIIKGSEIALLPPFSGG